MNQALNLPAAQPCKRPHTVAAGKKWSHPLCDRAPRRGIPAGWEALETRADRTGGVAFFPASLSDLGDIGQTMARDIRSQYTNGYKPADSQPSPGYRSIQVEARARGYRQLTVRTRNGYYAGPPVS